MGYSDHAARGRTSRSICAPLSCFALLRSCIACRLIQNSGVVPKKRASRSAVSAVTERSPFTIAPMRVAGTRNDIASAFTDRPSGTRNSSASTSPGCVVTRFGVPEFLMIVDDFDMGRTLLGPIEAYAPLVVDPDRMLTAAVARQRFNPVRGRCPQVVKPAGAIEHVKLSQRLFFDGAEAFHEIANPEPVRIAVAKRLNHQAVILRNA